MRAKRIAVGIAVVLCIAVFLAGPASAVFQDGERGAGVRGPADGSRMAGLLDRLEGQGYDVSAIRAAVENGDPETARSLLQQFMEEHKGELPAPPQEVNREERIAGLLDRLEEQGYDVTAIRAAIENGDQDTAHRLLRQFLEEHPDELPAPPEHGGRPNTMGALLDRLEAKGFDVSEIRSAVEAGDTETAHTLLNQFMEEHRDSLPGKPQNCGRGPFGNRNTENAE